MGRKRIKGVKKGENQRGREAGGRKEEQDG